jgi:hypothetical protein
MKEASFSFSCFTAFNKSMSTCLQRYSSVSSSNVMDKLFVVPQITIQVLAAFSPDGFFFNNPKIVDIK